MSSLFKNNAYHVLGLPVEAGQDEINGRVKELKARLEIDEVPTYDLDIPLFNPAKYRVIDSVEKAQEAVTSPFDKLKEVFFWFQINDETDQIAFGLIQEGDYSKALEKWWEKAKKTRSATLHYRRNYAILANLILRNRDRKKLLRTSLSSWKRIWESDPYWDRFERHYKVFDDLNTATEVFSKFRDLVDDYLNDFYTMLSNRHSRDIYLKSFAKNISTDGELVRKEFLNPTFNRILSELSQAEKIEVTARKEPESEEIKTLKESAKNIEKQFENLEESGYGSIDRAYKLRKNVLDVYRQRAMNLIGNHQLTEAAASVLESMKTIAERTPREQKVKNDLEEIKKLQNINEEFAPIETLIENQNFEKAFSKLNKKEDQLQKQQGNQFKTTEMQRRLSRLKKVCVINISTQLHEDAFELWERGNYARSKEKFDRLFGLIYNNPQVLGLQKEDLDEILTELDRVITRRTSPRFSDNLMEFSESANGETNLEALQSIRNDFVEKVQEGFGESVEGMLFVVIIDAYLFNKFSKEFSTERDTEKKHGDDQIHLGFTLLTIYFLIFCFPIGLIFMWNQTNWSKTVKWSVTLLIFPLLILIASLGD